MRQPQFLLRPDFAVDIQLVPILIASVSIDATSIMAVGSGPTNGVYTIMVSQDLTALPQVWTAIATNNLNNAGGFSFNIPLPPGSTTQYYRLRLP